MSKDEIFKNKKDPAAEKYAVEEYAAEIQKHEGRPVPREVRSQKAQYETFGTPGMGRKDRKIKMEHKQK